MSNVSQNILDKIKKEQIKPTPKWHFLLKKWLFWVFFVISIVIGSLAFGVMLRLLVHSDWDLAPMLCGSYWRCFFQNLPYFWLLFLLAFIGLAYYHFRHTTTGYRYKSFWIVGGSVVISMLIGFTFFTIGVARHTEEIAEKHLPYYDKMVKHRRDVWQQPEKGHLAGKVVEVKPRKFLMLIDFGKKKWEVTISKKHPPIKQGMRIKVIGVQIGDGKFEAKEIRPWRR